MYNTIRKGKQLSLSIVGENNRKFVKEDFLK